MSYLAFEKDLDRAALFLAAGVPETGAIPAAFLMHSIRVGLYLQEKGYTKEVVLAGFLHDAVEDTDYSLTDVEAQFGADVARLVGAATLDERLDRLERSREVMKRCKAAGVDALRVKAADLYDNLRYYLQDGNPALFDWLLEILAYFLEISAAELDHEQVWQDLQEQRQRLEGFISED